MQWLICDLAGPADRQFKPKAIREFARSRKCWLGCTSDVERGQLLGGYLCRFDFGR
jgi:hypothetical protein